MSSRERCFLFFLLIYCGSGSVRLFCCCLVLASHCCHFFQLILLGNMPTLQIGESLISRDSVSLKVVSPSLDLPDQLIVNNTNISNEISILVCHSSRRGSERLFLFLSQGHLQAGTQSQLNDTRDSIRALRQIFDTQCLGICFCHHHPFLFLIRSFV